MSLSILFCPCVGRVLFSPTIYFDCTIRIILFIYLLNFNYTDLNIQIVDKLTIKINEKLQDLNN